ncbi:hypothetical protein CHS0354_035854 [Potamilus streckersoni]|uniref:Receptor ligand binding region domain-containing protein n=1 Tax=Potamilus streckersoni TaxID=2493646 RepID=A0AAE0SXA0_9BIVA|nr:hypothetical protein CHS0354_035854 [Potamilus streckersoni]
MTEISPYSRASCPINIYYHLIDKARADYYKEFPRKRSKLILKHILVIFLLLLVSNPYRGAARIAFNSQRLNTIKKVTPKGRNMIQGVSHISFFSTSTVLSSRDRYPYFLRTIPSDVNQAQAMVELVRLFNWTYVSVIYEESSYGMQGFNELEKLLKHFGICIAATEKLLKDSGVPSEEFYDRIVLSLKSKYHARGVIIFGSDQEVGELMKAVRRQNATVMFTWIGSDGWGGRGLAYEGKEPEVTRLVCVY